MHCITGKGENNHHDSNSKTKVAQAAVLAFSHWL
jgi:hypothetical protein